MKHVTDLILDQLSTILPYTLVSSSFIAFVIACLILQASFAHITKILFMLRWKLETASIKTYNREGVSL